MRPVKLLISGRVQGVFFRKFTKQKADALNVFGTVRNLDDGRVEIIALSETSNLESFIQWCHRGPIIARVDQVTITELDNPIAELISFEII
jgi:acylphosphatase